MAEEPRWRWPGRSSSHDGLRDSPQWTYEPPDPAVFGSLESGSLDDRPRFGGQRDWQQDSVDDLEGAVGGRSTTDRHRSQRRQRSGAVFSLVALLFGVAFLGSGLWIRAGTRPYSDGITVTGVVVSVEESSSGSDGTTYSPVVEFVDPSTGAAHTVTRQISSSSRPRLGDRWDVSFRPGEPEGGRVLGRWDWAFWGAFASIGVIVLVSTLSVGYFQLRRRRRR